MLLILLLLLTLVALFSLAPDDLRLNAEFCRAEYLQCQRSVSDEDKTY